MSVAGDLRAILNKMPESFLAEKAADLEAVIQLDLLGDGGGQWVINIANGDVSIEEGQADSANLSLSLAAGDYVALSRGEANPVNLFMTGNSKCRATCRWR